MPCWAGSHAGGVKSPVSTRFGFSGFSGALLLVFEGSELLEGEELCLMGPGERRTSVRAEMPVVTSDSLGSGCTFNLRCSEIISVHPPWTSSSFISSALSSCPQNPDPTLCRVAGTSQKCSLGAAFAPCSDRFSLCQLSVCSLPPPRAQPLHLAVEMTAFFISPPLN